MHAPTTTLLFAALTLAACEATTDPPVVSFAAAAPLIETHPKSVHLCWPYQPRGSTRCCCLATSVTLEIANAGGGRLDWTASKNRKWFRIRPREGTAPGTITVSVNDLTGTVVGEVYHGALRISAAGASNSPLTVPVTL